MKPAVPRTEDLEPARLLCRPLVPARASAEAAVTTAGHRVGAFVVTMPGGSGVAVLAGSLPESLASCWTGAANGSADLRRADFEASALQSPDQWPSLQSSPNLHDPRANHRQRACCDFVAQAALATRGGTELVAQVPECWLAGASTPGRVPPLTAAWDGKVHCGGCAAANPCGGCRGGGGSGGSSAPMRQLDTPGSATTASFSSAADDSLCWSATTRLEEQNMGSDRMRRWERTRWCCGDPLESLLVSLS
mmetsp:Transcript_26250/g.66093  ORF Transcript_26250/g.66093 Transcript_26250/m.66093 type:complete len:250 (+) Transcript_26250:187-936(+)